MREEKEARDSSARESILLTRMGEVIRETPVSVGLSGDTCGMGAYASVIDEEEAEVLLLLAAARGGEVTAAVLAVVLGG